MGKRSLSPVVTKTLNSRGRTAIVAAFALIIFILTVPSARHGVQTSVHNAHTAVSTFTTHHGNSSHWPTTIEETDYPTWLIWTTSPAHSRQRREIIRSTWQTLYANVSFTARFVIGNPDPIWLPVIMQENATYGDMIMLPTIEDDWYIANHYKSMEFMKHLSRSAAASSDNEKASEKKKKKKKGRRSKGGWDFVSKIDDDAFLDARTFHREFILPNANAERTIISRVIQYGQPYSYPGGQFYTLTWDLVTLLSKLYTETPVRDEDEDFLVARLLKEEGEKWDFVELSQERAFDVITQGNMTDRAINPHRLKTDEQYLAVAGMYDEGGFRGTLTREGVDLMGRVREAVR